MSSQDVLISICQKLVAMFKKILWQGASKTRKWALLSRERLNIPIKDGGLGLLDPYILKQVMVAKLWWRWTLGGQDLWKKI